MNGILETILSEVQQLRAEVASLREDAGKAPDTLVGTDEICAKLGVDRQTFYKHFRNHPDVVKIGRQYKCKRSHLNNLQSC